MGSQKRIAKELNELVADPPEGISVSLADESDLFKWKVVMDGPENSPYSGGKFVVNLVLPSEYPFKPPTINFQTKIYHPNVTDDGKGSMCLGILKADEWKPASKIASALRYARQLLSEPQPDDAVEARIADHFRNDRKGYEKVAKEWTRKYAK